jgi:hypothetical protein
MNHNADFKHVRNTVIEYLLGPGRQGKSVEETVAWSASAQPVTA